MSVDLSLYLKVTEATYCQSRVVSTNRALFKTAMISAKH